MADKAAAVVADDWRKSVLQSYRNNEVKEIAKVLASVEGSASVTPTSKLMLASRFEDSIFKSSRSLEDYRKKIAKRLKKVKRSFKKSTANADTEASGSRDKEELRNKLKRDFGEDLRYIAKNAAAAVEDLKRKLGAEKAKQLQQHTDSCQNWALDLGIISVEELEVIRRDAATTAAKAAAAAAASEANPNATSNATSNATATSTTSVSIELPQAKPTSKPTELSLSLLQKIEQHLQHRVGNIRSYVVKHSDPDRFYQETIQAKDVSFSKNVAAGRLFRDYLRRRMHQQQQQAASAGSQGKGTNANANANANVANTNRNPVEDNPLLALQTALEKAQAGVPPPTRQDSRQLEGSLRHLDKIRAASTALMTYWTLPADQRVTIAPRDTLKKINEVAREGTDFVLEAVKELEQRKPSQRGLANKKDNNSNNHNHSNSNQNAENSSTPVVSLQDAWSKPLELPSASTATTATATTAPAVEAAASEHGQKRPRTNSYRPYCRSRVLFRSERRPPQELLAAIRRKGARLEMVNSGDAGAVHIVLEFETAFTMTIFFSPLSVSLRAKPAPAGGNNNNNDDDDNDDNDNDEQTTTTTTVSWKPLSHGLTPWGSTLDSGDFRRKRKDRELGVWGVTGTYESIGRVVEERLRDASTHATHVLRKCFRNHVKDNTGMMEVQLLEGSALLEFLQVARSTYMPHWEDRDF